MATNSQEYTFWKFLQENKIEIPIIQRDYAQGRSGKEKLRETFLKDLKNALDATDNSKLKLDFVYGNVENGRLNPFDGQQRLTTLWLLHWYIAYKADEIENNTDIFKHFTYETRISSREFCEKLSEFTEKTDQSIVDHIQNQTWFYSEWKQDPTIAAMLNMLGGTPVKDKDAEVCDGLDKIFNKTDNAKFKDYWTKLTNNNECPMIFYYLPLNNFEMSDDLYVKMNARGKQLTSFENFKADLIKWMKAENIYNEETELDGREIDYHMSISQKMDNVWAKFFWTYSKTEEDEKIPDRFLLNFFNRYLLNLFIVESQDSLDDIQENDTFKYFYGDEGYDAELTYHSFEKYQTIFEKKNVIHNMEKCLDCFSKHYEPTIRDIAKAPWGNKWDFFQTELDNLSQRVIFLAITLFIEKNDINDNFPITQFKQWMRVVWNIVENTENSIKEIISAMRLINELSEHTKDIYAFLSDENSTIKSGASEEQIAEERKKAKLIKDDDKWEEELIIAEKHPYFSGQIYFLLHIEDKDLQEFILYRDKAINVFKENLGHNDNYYFHRALLALAMDHGDSDYFIKKSNKYSFCEKEDIKNNMLRYRKNNEGKFYYDLIKSLLLDVVQSPKTADEDIEKKATRVEINDKKWQTFFITTPHCFDYCKQKLIKWDDEQTIYLISKLQMSSKHVELRTYYLWKEWIIKQKGQLDPFKSAWYYDRSEYPCAVLDLFDYEETRFKLDIFFQDGCYQFILKSSDNKANDKLLEIKEKLKNSIEIEGNNECLEFPSCSTVEKAKKQIEEICELLKQI